jgi:GxxExxY protein
MTENELSKIVVETAIDIHRRLGPGLFESVYGIILSHELRKKGLSVEREVDVPIEWDGVRFEAGFRADVIVERILLLELKSVEVVAPVHKKQVLTYLRLMNIKLGILLNFGAPLIKDGIHRVVNGLEGDEE